MPTTVTDTIGSGGDYADISSWIAGTANDLVSADEVRVGEIIDAAAFDEASSIDVTGATTDATRYRHLTVASGVRHNGTGDGSGARYPYTGGGHAFTVNEDYFEVSWLDLSYPSGGAGSDEVFRVNNDGFKLHHCLGHDIPHDDGDLLYAGADNLTIELWNNFAWDIGRAAVHLQQVAGVTVYVYNMTAWHCATATTSEEAYGAIGFNDVNSGCEIVAKNTAAFDSTDSGAGSDEDFFNSDANSNPGQGSGTFSGDNNASSDTTAPGADSLTGLDSASQFESESSPVDLHIVAGANLEDAGQDLSSDANRAVSDDIDGDSRPQGSAYEIGGDELIPSVSTAGPVARGFNLGLMEG